MSNKGRSRTGFKPCQHCGSTDRDSNGQCACRNKAYREKAKNAAKSNAPLPAKAPTKKATKKAESVAPEATVEATPPAAKAAPERYLLMVLGEEVVPYARKDAAISNGQKSGRDWRVEYKGKVVAVSDDA